MHSVGVPKEVKALEKRVGLVPSAAEELCRSGIIVCVEAGAGVASGFADADYLKAGARIVASPAEVYSSGLVVKVKEPQSSEFELLSRAKILFCYLHLASPDNCNLVRALINSGITAIGFETVEKSGSFPLLAPMSEIAGGLSSAYAALLRSMTFTGAGEVKYPADFLGKLERVAAVYPSVPIEYAFGYGVIFGGGVAGFKAFQSAMKLKGKVAIVEKNPERRSYLRQAGADVFSPEELPFSVLENADVLIGAVHARGARAFQVMDAALLKRVSAGKKKVIIDISIDQGGNFPEARSTTYKSPLYFDSFGNLRFSVSNIPSFAGRGASEALSKVVLPYVLALAKNPQEAAARFPELENAVNVRQGRILIPAIEQVHHDKQGAA